ncbi:MAG: alanine:cation symporter family protein [Undibacterium sp.]|nr:alanine:cation symporter family protein [Undibacterium sp.]
MNDIFVSVNRFFDFIVPIADFLWEFPTKEAAYSAIPVLGKLSFVVLLLLGTGMYFCVKTRLVQVRRFTVGLGIMLNKKASSAGISPMAAFLLSSAMRIGPGNIMGVTGAISVGGPGAMFWMWVSAFLGMATAFAEAVLAQLFKQKAHGSYVGGMPFYGQFLLGKRRFAGVVLASIFIVYALFSIPGQSFHLFTALGAVAETVAGQHFDRSSEVYWGIAGLLVVGVTITVVGGLKSVTRVTDLVVPIMAGIYSLLVLIIIVINYDLLPYFFKTVLSGAFAPQALFGGAFGVALAQGIKRGLMSNEAGQGTITIAAAVSENDHPCEQGFIQAIGVFLDTMIICSMTGFMIVMAHLWTGDAAVGWESIKDAKLTVFLTSVRHLVPNVALHDTVTVILASCYAMFAFTTLIGLILFAEIAANQISQHRIFIRVIRLSGALLFVPFGALAVLAGLELGNLWAISDLVNIMVVFANMPLLFIGSRYVFLCLEHYHRSGGARFVSREIGLETEVWK